MKAKVFIGSSSESLKIANDLQMLLEQQGGVMCRTWKQSFYDVADHTLENLTLKAKEFDFAVFIFTPDDSIQVRGTQRQVTRDNVVFEMGLFIGYIGKDRTFFLTTENTDFHLPSDLNGISAAKFDLDRYNRMGEGEGVSALGVAANSIRRRIERIGVKAKSIFDEEGMALEDVEAFCRKFYEKGISLEAIDKSYEESAPTRAYCAEKGISLKKIEDFYKKFDERGINQDFCDKSGTTCAYFDKEKVPLQKFETCYKNFVKDISIEKIEQFYKDSGLTYAYTERDEAYEQMLKDIAGAETRVSMYARVYLSKLIKGASKFSKALIKAISKSPKSRFLVEHISTNYCLESNRQTIEQLWAHEDKHDDPEIAEDERRWSSIEDYVGHLKGSDNHFIKVQKALYNNLPSNHKMRRIEFRRAYTTNCFLPYSMLIIDDKIMYISFYTLTEDRYGTYAPTLRLKCDSEEDTWGAFFLEQIKKLEILHVDGGTIKKI